MGASKLVAGVWSTGKAAIGIAVCAWVSFNYAWVFAFTSPVLVWAAMVLCFLLLSLPIWLGLFRRPLRSLLVYYLGAVVFLAVAAFLRFPVEALMTSRGN